MTEPSEPVAPGPLVLHVIPTSVARGAQREARALADALDEPGVRSHRVLSLFGGPPEVNPDFSLGFAAGPRGAQGYRPLSVLHLRSALERLQPAVIVAHGGEPLKYIVPATFGRRSPLAYYAIGTYAGPPRRLQLALWRRLMARADVVAAEGYEVKSECTERLGVPADRVVMTPNGRDPDVFRPGGRSAADERPLIIFVGALTEGKRPARFVEVVAALRTQGMDFRAQLIGGGPQHRELIGPARAAAVELLGVRSDIAALMQQADILVFPSRATGEGMPGVLIEAGLSGLPVVTTDVPGVSTIVSNGETGVVVAEDDFDALTTAIARLVGDEALRKAMGKRARLRCEELFSLRTVARKWSELLAPLLPPV